MLTVGCLVQETNLWVISVLWFIVWSLAQYIWSIRSVNTAVVSVTLTCAPIGGTHGFLGLPVTVQTTTLVEGIVYWGSVIFLQLLGQVGARGGRGDIVIVHALWEVQLLGEDHWS